MRLGVLKGGGGIKGEEEALNNDLKAYKGSKDALNGDRKPLKKDEEV